MGVSQHHLLPYPDWPHRKPACPDPNQFGFSPGFLFFGGSFTWATKLTTVTTSSKMNSGLKSNDLNMSFSSPLLKMDIDRLPHPLLDHWCDCFPQAGHPNLHLVSLSHRFRHVLVLGSLDESLLLGLINQKAALLVIQSDPFGMVSSRDPFGKVVGDLQRSGMKLGHGLNHLAEVFWIFCDLPSRLVYLFQEKHLYGKIPFGSISSQHPKLWDARISPKEIRTVSLSGSMVIQLPALKRCELKGAFLNFPENKDQKKGVGDNSHLSQQWVTKKCQMFKWFKQNDPCVCHE